MINEVCGLVFGLVFGFWFLVWFGLVMCSFLSFKFNSIAFEFEFINESIRYNSTSLTSSLF